MGTNHKDIRNTGLKADLCGAIILMLIISLSSCHYPRPNLEDENLEQRVRDSLTYLYERHYTWDANLEVRADSVPLELLPVKDAYYMLHKGDRVVVAEFAVHPTDSVDSIWVKLAHSQDVQGWLREAERVQRYPCFVLHRRLCHLRSRLAGTGLPPQAAPTGVLQRHRQPVSAGPMPADGLLCNGL